MTLQNDDLFLVNRGGESFKTEYGLLKENINEDQGVTISEDPPADPGEGDLWYNSEDGRLYVWYVNETTGIVTSVSTRNGGSGYNTQETNVETAGGTGFGLTVDIDPGVGGNFANPQVNNGGHGYTVGDYIIITGAGHQNGTLNVTAVNTVSAGQWVDASPDGGDIGGGETLWTRNGTTLEPANAGDDVSAAAGTFSGAITGTRPLTSDGNTIFRAAAPSGGKSDKRWFFYGDVAGVAGTSSGWASDGSIKIAGGVSSGGITNEKIALNADGSATFETTQGYQKFQTNGATSLCRKTTTAGVTAFQVLSNVGGTDSIKFTVSSDGTVKAAGTITGNSLRFELEPDNPANYTTTMVDGEEQQVYTGPTLDVKEKLLDFVARIEALEAKVQQLEGGN